jgi:hypothetical protein
VKGETEPQQKGEYGKYIDDAGWERRTRVKFLWKKTNRIFVR